MHDQGNSNSIPIKFAQVGEECSSHEGTRTLFVTDKVFFFERLRQKLGFSFGSSFLHYKGESVRMTLLGVVGYGR